MKATAGLERGATTPRRVCRFDRADSSINMGQGSSQMPDNRAPMPPSDLAECSSPCLRAGEAAAR